GCPANGRPAGGALGRGWPGTLAGRGGGAIGTPGRTPCVAAGRTVLGAKFAGRGCRGPERISPGFGDAAGAVGIGLGGGGTGRPGTVGPAPGEACPTAG